MWMWCGGRGLEVDCFRPHWWHLKSPTCVAQMLISINLLAQKSVNCRRRGYRTKKAVLSQRWPRNAPYTLVPWKISGLLDYAHGYYSQHFSLAFVWIDPMNVSTKFEFRSFTRFWDNRGYPKNGQSLDTPTLHFLLNFERAFTWIGLVNVPPPNLKSVALPVPEIRWGS